MYPNREAFSASPLALVAAEIRFTDAPRLRRQAVLDDIAIALEGRFPVAQPLQETNLSLSAGQPPQMHTTTGLQMRDLASTASMAIAAGSLSYETTAYGAFEELLDAVLAACEALEAADVRPAIQRIGLRYIDEVRVPDSIVDVRSWSGWIDDRLIDQLSIGPNVPVTTAQGIVSYDLGAGRGLNFRFAALSQGAVVVSPTLKRPAYASGPFFVLDFDGYEDFTTEGATLFSSSVVANTLRAVHAPAGATFQNSITEKSRDLFRGRST